MFLREGDVYLCVLFGYPNLFRREHIFLFLKSSLRFFSLFLLFVLCFLENVYSF